MLPRQARRQRGARLGKKTSIGRRTPIGSTRKRHAGKEQATDERIQRLYMGRIGHLEIVPRIHNVGKAWLCCKTAQIQGQEES